MRKKLLTSFAIVILSIFTMNSFYATPQASVEDALAQVNYTAVPLRKNVQNEYEVKARINGSKEIDMLLSFQITQTMFDIKALDELGVEYYETNQEYTINNDEETLYATRTDSINIGKGKIGPEEIYCVEFSEFDALDYYRVGGILGRDFLIKYNALIDFGEQKLYLRTRY